MKTIVSSTRTVTARIGKLACLLGAVVLTSTSQAAVYVLKVTATPTNVSGNAITVDDPRINGKPNFKLLAIHDYGNLVTGHVNDSPLGILYNTTLKKWQIVNEDGSAITSAANSSSKFNVLVSTATIRVLAAAANSDFDWNFFFVQKKNPAARFLVSHAVNPAPLKTAGNTVNKNIGMFYVTAGAVTTNVWSIYNDDQAAPLAAAYNVLDITNTKIHHSSVLVSSAGNTTGDQVSIDDPITNNNPNAVVFASHAYNPQGVAGNLFNKTIGVYYNGTKWTLYTEDLSAVPAGKSFFVEVFSNVQ